MCHLLSGGPIYGHTTGYHTVSRARSGHARASQAKEGKRMPRRGMRGREGPKLGQNYWRDGASRSRQAKHDRTAPTFGWLWLLFSFFSVLFPFALGAGVLHSRDTHQKQPGALARQCGVFSEVHASPNFPPLPLSWEMRGGMGRERRKEEKGGSRQRGERPYRPGFA